MERGFMKKWNDIDLDEPDDGVYLDEDDEDNDDNGEYPELYPERSGPDDDDDIEISDDDDLTEPVITKQLTEEEIQKATRRGRLRAAGKLICVLVIIGCVLGAGTYAVYDHYYKYYSTHFYDGTTINGKDVSRRTVDVIKNSIRSDISKYSLTVGLKDGGVEVLSSDDVGWAYVDDGKVDEFMANQDAEHWYKHFRDGHEYALSAGTTYDRDKATESIRAMHCFEDEYVTKPVDAALVQNANGNYEVTAEIEGNLLNEEKAEKLILEALDSSESEVSLVKPDCYIHPKVFRDNENLCRRRDQWNRLLGIHISYEFGDNYEDIDRNVLLPYITDDGENVTLATDWVSDLVYEWGDRYDTFGRGRYFTTYSGDEVYLPDGDYGWCINKDETIAKLKSELENADSGVKSCVFLYSAMGWDNNDITGTYVEVSIDDQRLWCYKDYELIAATDVVTGMPRGDRETERGIWAIDAKKSPATLGTYDVQGYSSPVNWWCPFNGGQGLHDAPWRGAFGDSIYLSNGSHGCVNIPVDEMEAIYDAVSIGTAVIVY